MGPSWGCERKEKKARKGSSPSASFPLRKDSPYERGKSENPGWPPPPKKERRIPTDVFKLLFIRAEVRKSWASVFCGTPSIMPRGPYRKKSHHAREKGGKGVVVEGQAGEIEWGGKSLPLVRDRRKKGDARCYDRTGGEKKKGGGGKKAYS